MALRVVIADLGMGNLRSVARATERAASDASVSVNVVISASPDDLHAADHLVVPGQGAFRDAADALAGPLGDAVKAHIARGSPYLGICLGMQAIFESSEEAPGRRGLGVLQGTVKKLPGGEVGVKIPHMGWNQLTITQKGAGPLAVYDHLPPYVYFVHSYHVVPNDPSLIAAVVAHGGATVTAAIHHDNLTLTQFHPEKSQAAGLLLLSAFVRK